MRTYAITLLCLMSAGCAPSAKRTRTIVTGRIEPRHFQFYTVVKQRDNKAGGCFGAATPASPLGLLCEAFKKTLRARIQASIGGSRLETVCREEAIPVQFGEFIP